MSILENHANPVASVILWRKRVVPWFDFSVQPGGYPLRNLTTEHRTEVAQRRSLLAKEPTACEH